ncbi:stalk domain-containing protein [Heyndrickxia sp. NPDC080065]|uniref:stalk domain-containing protein n=1 Tax=Heyndrickxia sp. NPDC080065 TaxID=3390568 RepID=UPI003D064169
MKPRISSLVITAALLTGSAVSPVAINEVSAKVQQQNVQKATIIVNGQEKVVSVISSNKIKLYSIDYLSKIMSAAVKYNNKTKAYEATKKVGNKTMKIEYKVGSNNAVVNGKKTKLSAPPKMVGKTLFVEAGSFVKSLGGDILIDKNLLITANSKIKLMEKSLVIDGTSKKVKSLFIDNKQRYSVQDIAKLFSASTKITNKDVLVSKKGKTIKLKLSQNNITINNKAVKLKQNPILVKGTVYADLSDLIKAFDGDLLTLSNGYFVSTAGLVSGDTYNPQWINSSTLLVTNESEQTDSQSLLLNTTSKKSVFKIDGYDLAVSPNGKQAIYSDESGKVYLVDLSSKKVKEINHDDDSAKQEFVWSKDGKSVYFIQGDKSEKISSISIADGKIMSLFEDKLTSKSNLRVSSDGKKLLYLVGKEGTTSFTDGEDPDVDQIDLTDTEEQFYLIDLNAAELAAKPITTTKDNKVFPDFLSNGDIVYLSADPDSEELPVLKMINGDRTATLISNKEIIQSLVTPQGKIMTLAAEKNGESIIYEVNPSTKKLTKVAQTKLKLTSFAVSNDGKSIAAITDGKNGDVVVIYKNGIFESLTK